MVEGVAKDAINSRGKNREGSVHAIETHPENENSFLCTVSSDSGQAFSGRNELFVLYRTFRRGLKNAKLKSGLPAMGVEFIYGKPEMPVG